MHEWVLLEDRKQLDTASSGLFFDDPVDEVICWDGSQLLASLQRLDYLKQQGYYLVGFISYEAGYYFQSLFSLLEQPHEALCPLLHFLVFKTYTKLHAHDVDAKLQIMARAEASTFFIDQLHLSMTQDRYDAAFQQIKHYIREGHTYQVNLTSKYTFEAHGSPTRLYQHLRERQKVSYSGLLMFRDYQILTLSPELFFSKKGSCVRVKPMKGTVARAHDPLRDDALKAWLCSDPKSMAENTMIVDLLRNDLSVFSHAGSVITPQLLHVESYETVHQMVSCVESQVDENIMFSDMICHLFPCGSITGAPKRRTMEIIHEVELEPRRVYTGAIGYIMPNNDMCFNVGIRTLLLKNGHGELGVGGGIVHDSDVSAEFDEMQLKAQFFTKGVCNT